MMGRKSQMQMRTVETDVVQSMVFFLRHIQELDDVFGELSR